MPIHRSAFAPWLVVPFALAACGGADDSGDTSPDVVEVAPDAPLDPTPDGPAPDAAEVDGGATDAVAADTPSPFDAPRDAVADVARDAVADVPADAAVTGGYDLFLLAGQSNMVGRGAPRSATLDATDPMAFQWGRFGASDGRIIPATARLEHNDANSLDRVGLGLSFAKAYLARTGRARPVLLVPTARGGTGFSANQWNPGDTLFEDAVARANAAMRSHPGNRFVGILWHQGEADVGRLSTAAYAADLDRLVYRLRGRVVGAETAVFVVGEFCPSWRPTTSAASVLAALDATPARVPFSAVAPSAGLTGNAGGDNIHFNAPSQRTYGARYDAASLAARANRPRSSPPDAPVALTATPGSTTVALAWRPPTATGGAPVLGYRVALRRPAAAAWTEQYALTATYTFTGLGASTAYEVRVAAHNQAGVGPFATASTTTRAP